jgi:hypothetical protein
MAFGMAIQTPSGFLDVANLRVGRHYGAFTYTAQSGSRFEPGFTDANGAGHIACIANDGKIVPRYSWNEATKTLTWSLPPDSSGAGFITPSQISSNFRFVFWSFN